MNFKDQKFTCLMYHEIEVNNSNKYAVPPHLFLEHIKYAKDLDYNLCSLEKVFENKNKFSCLTFDDGHKSNLWAAEQLAKENFTATFFIVKDFCLGLKSYLNISELKEIIKMGHNLGIHGKSHQHWTRLDSDIFKTDFLECKKWLEDLSGLEVISCAAPCGKLDDRIRKIIKEINIKYLRNSIPKINESILNQEIYSIGMRGKDNLNILKKKLSYDEKYYSRKLLEKKIKNMINTFLNR